MNKPTPQEAADQLLVIMTLEEARDFVRGIIQAGNDTPDGIHVKILQDLEARPN